MQRTARSAAGAEPMHIIGKARAVATCLLFCLLEVTGESHKTRGYRFLKMSLMLDSTERGSLSKIPHKIPL